MLSELVERNDLHPRVMVTVRSDNRSFGKLLERDAGTVVEWHMPAGEHPMDYSISVPTDNGVRGMISKAGSFVVNFLSPAFASELDSLVHHDGTLTDIWSLVGVTKGEAEKVDGPLVNEAKAHLECEVIQETESGDHTIFVGRVLKKRLNS